MATEYDEMTNDELREELEARGLKVSGNKDDLVARLELNDAEGGSNGDDTPADPGPEPEADKDVVEAGPDADAEAVAEAAADVNAVVDRGSIAGDEAKGDFTVTGDLNAGANIDPEAAATHVGATTATQAPDNRGTVLTGAEVRGRLVPERGEELEPIQRSRASFGGLTPQSQPDNLSPEVSGYVILPDGRRQPLEITD